MININVSDRGISGSINGSPFSIEYEKELYDKLVELQEKESRARTIEEAKQVWEEAENLTSPSAKQMLESKSPYLSYNPAKNTYHLKDDDGNISPIPMPESLSSKLLYAVDKNLPVDPLIKFFTRLLRNPNIIERNSKDAIRFTHEVCDYVSQTFVSSVLKEKYLKEGYNEQVAEEMATVPQTPITMEGLLSTKKVVRPLEQESKYKYILDDEGNKKKVLRDGIKKTIDEDTGEVTVSGPDFSEDWIFEPYVAGKKHDAFRCGEGDDAPLGHIIRVGSEMRLDKWEQINCDPRHSCVKGLHTGNHDYVDSWETNRNVTLNCFVDPASIGCVPYRDVAGVMRVKELFPHSIKDRETDNKNIYHSSTYAALGDERWRKYRQEAVARFDKEVEDFKQEINKKRELL